jgi:hypothetical protein
MKAGQSSGGHHPTNYAMTLTQLKLSLHELIDCPFSFRTRMTSAGLMVSNPKLAFSGDDLRDTVQLLGGMYKPSKDGAVPLPKPRKPAIRASESSRPTVAADDLPATPTPPPAPTLPPPSYTSPSPPPIPILPSDGWESKNSIQPPAIQQGFDKKHLYSFSMGIFGGPCESPETKVATTPPMACPSAQFNPTLPANVPAESFDILATTFAQMLDARQPQAAIPALTPDVQVRVKETRTGQFMAIGGVNTDVGLSDEVQLCPGPVVPVSPVQAIPACHGPVVPPCPVQAIPSYPMQSVLPRPVPGTCEIQITGVVLPQAAVAVPAVRSHVGTWVRVVGPVVYTIQLTADHMTITATSAIEHTDDKVVTERAVMTADYHLMRDGTTAVGLITSFDAQLDGDLPEGVNYKGFMGELSQLQKVLTDKPLALSLRMYGDALVIGNVRLPEMQGGEAWSLVTVLGGRYSPAGDKPLQKPKIARAPMLPRYPLPAAVITPVYPYGNVGTPVVVPAPGYIMPPGGYPMPAPSPYMPAGAEAPVQFTPSCPTPGGIYPIPIQSTTGAPVISGCGGTMFPPLPYSPTPAPACPQSLPYTPAPACPTPSPQSYPPSTGSLPPLPSSTAPGSPQTSFPRQRFNGMGWFGSPD